MNTGPDRGRRAPPHLRGVMMGGLATAGDLGAAIGPLVAYALLETAGLRAADGLCAALMLSALLLLAAAPRPPPRGVAACGQHPSGTGRRRGAIPSH